MSEESRPQGPTLAQKIFNGFTATPVTSADSDGVENPEPWDDAEGEPISGEYGSGRATFDDPVHVGQRIEYDYPAQPKVMLVKPVTPKTAVISAVTFGTDEVTKMVAPERPCRATLRISLQSGGPFYVGCEEASTYHEDTSAVVSTDYPYFDLDVTSPVFVRNLGGNAGRISIVESIYPDYGGAQ